MAEAAQAIPEPTRLVVIRHGETAWNAEGRLQGQRDIPLNALGRAQAARLADALRDEGLDAVVSSDLGRAWETAQALAGPLNLPLRADAGLRERCFGIYEGLTRDEVAQRWPEGYARWLRREPEHAPPEAESLVTFSARCVQTVHALARAHPGQHLALVCHGGVLDCLYRAATGLALDAPRTWQLGNAGINRLLFTGQHLSLVGWNDQGHLARLSLDEIG